MSDHMYHRSHSGPLSLNTHSGSRSAPLSSTGVPLHLLNAAQASGGQNPGPKTPPREEAEPPGKEMIHAGARKPNLQIQVGGKVGTMSKSGPLTPTGVPAATGSQPGTQTGETCVDVLVSSRFLFASCQSCRCFASPCWGPILKKLVVDPFSIRLEILALRKP
jgi:hypothetical protein